MSTTTKNINQPHYVYILLCSNQTHYVGCTNNLKDRVTRHNRGYIKSTENRLPVKLKTNIAFDNGDQAFDFEQYLKSGSGRAFMNKRLI